ncbi:MAG: AMP-binding protein [Microthrixaceae bacterium]
MPETDQTANNDPADGGNGPREQFNLATVSEVVAAAVPDREALIFGDVRLTFAQLAERTRRLASYLHSQGLGAHLERGDLQPHESGQDHLALYLYNGNEYIEGMLGAYKARVAPFNVNYRYVQEELRYLLTDADTKAVIYHATFAPALAEVLDELPEVKVLIQVADDSGNDLLPGAVDYETVLADLGSGGAAGDAVTR